MLCFGVVVRFREMSRQTHWANGDGPVLSETQGVQPGGAMHFPKEFKMTRSHLYAAALESAVEFDSIYD